MWNVFIFAVVGLVVGSTACLFHPRQRSTRIIERLMIASMGAVVGGIISWSWWPAGAAGEFRSGNIMVSFLGAVIVLSPGVAFRLLGAMIVVALWAGIAYKRSLRRPGKSAPATGFSLPRQTVSRA